MRRIVGAGLLAILLGSALWGCGSGDKGTQDNRNVTQITPPADETFNTSVRSARYTLTDLGPGTASAINERGQVAGSSPNLAYVWQNGVRHYLGALTGDIMSNATAINDNGVVIGISFHDYQETCPPGVGCGAVIFNVQQSFVWQNGVLSAYAADAVRPLAAAINNAGVAVGAQQISGVSQPFRWQNGQLSPISLSSNPAEGKRSGEVVAINNSGQIAGSRTAPGAMVGTFETAFLIGSNGVLTDIGVPSGGLYSRVTALNDNGQVAGISYINGYIVAFLWQSGKFTLINGNFAPASLNNKGQVVGQEAYNRGALLYENGKITNLNTLINADAGWELLAANGINDAGQIAGIGKHNGVVSGFLLTPQ